MRCVLPLFVACALVAQNQVAVPPAAPGEVSVDAGSRFEPCFWTLRCDVPRSENWLVVHRPWAEVEVKGASGLYVRCENREARRSGSTHDVFSGVFAYAGETFAWCGEISDPSCIATPGEYRVRVHWAVAGDRDTRKTPWCAFSIGATPDGEPLARARAAEDETWKAYRACMGSPLEFTPAVAYRPPDMAFVELLASEATAARQRLGHVATLPTRVRHRLLLLEIAWEERLASCEGDEAQQHRRWARVDEMCIALRKERCGYYGELAGLVQLTAWRRLSLHDDVLAAPWSASRLSVAIAFPELQGLLVIPNDPARNPAVPGPTSNGPWWPPARLRR